MKYLSILFLFCTPILLFAQKDKPVFAKDFSITTSEPYRVIDGQDKDYFYDNAGHSISVKTNEETVFVQIFDVKLMKEIKRQEYNDLPRGAKPQDLIYIGGKLYYTYLVIDTRGDDVNTLFARQIDIKSGAMKSPVVLFESKGATLKTTTTDQKSLTSGGRLIIRSYISSDSSKILFNYCREHLKKRNAINYDILGFFVFDSKLKKVWGDEITMPYTEREMDNLAYSVTKDGVAHMLILKHDLESKDSSTIELINIKNKNSVNVKKVGINSSFFFTTLNLKEDLSGNLICSGFYVKLNERVKMAFREDMFYLNYNGIKYFKIDTSGILLNSYDYDFPIDLINQNKSLKSQLSNKKKEAKDELGILNLVLRDVILSEDGSTYFIGEQFYYVQKTDAQGRNTGVSYHFEDVLITKIDKDGKLLWM